MVGASEQTNAAIFHDPLKSSAAVTNAGPSTSNVGNDNNGVAVNHSNIPLVNCSFTNRNAFSNFFLPIVFVLY